MHAKTTIGATIALLLNAIAVNAFHVESGISCDTVGAACQCELLLRSFGPYFQARSLFGCVARRA